MDLTIVISLLSSALICAGYINVSIVYRNFGIDPTKFFSIGDYLASSLEQIDNALYAIVGYMAGVIHGYRKQVMLPKYPEKQSTIRKWWPEIWEFVLGAGILIIAYLQWEIISTIPGIRVLLVISLLLFFQTPVYLLAFKYFQNSLSVSIWSMVLILFFVSMVVGAQTMVAEIMSDKDDEPFEVVQGDKRYTHENYKMIGANSRYMFLWDRKTRVEIVPLTSLDHVAFSNQQKAPSSFPEPSSRGSR